MRFNTLSYKICLLFMIVPMADSMLSAQNSETDYSVKTINSESSSKQMDQNGMRRVQSTASEEETVGNFTEPNSLQLDLSWTLNSAKDWPLEPMTNLELGNTSFTVEKKGRYNHLENLNFFNPDTHSAKPGFMNSAEIPRTQPSELVTTNSPEELKSKPVLNSAGLIELDEILDKESPNPLTRSTFFVSQEFGSHDFYRTTLGVSGPANDRGNLFYHVNVGYGQGGGHPDYEDLKNTTIDSGITWEPTPGLKIDLDFQYLNYKE